MSRPLTIDFHTHTIVPEVYDFVQKAFEEGKGPPRPFVSKVSKEFQDRQYKALEPKMLDPSEKLSDMDAQGIDIQVLSIELNHYCYWTEPKRGNEVARNCNEHISALVAKAPDRLVGLATVPLQSPALAIDELNHAVKTLGLRGVIVSSHAENRELGDSGLLEFWRTAEQLDVPVFIHPAGTSHPERLSQFFMWNSIGQPLEETIALCSMIYEGVLDAVPKLKIVMAHGGGYLPFYTGRADRAFEKRPESTKNINRKPSEYLRQVYFDTCIYNTDMLEFLAGKVGEDRLLMGSDYPLYLKDDDPVEFVNASSISDEGKRRILGATAAELLGLSVKSQ